MACYLSCFAEHSELGTGLKLGEGPSECPNWRCWSIKGSSRKWNLFIIVEHNNKVRVQVSSVVHRLIASKAWPAVMAPSPITAITWFFFPCKSLATAIPAINKLKFQFQHHPNTLDDIRRWSNLITKPCEDACGTVTNTQGIMFDLLSLGESSEPWGLPADGVHPRPSSRQYLVRVCLLLSKLIVSAQLPISVSINLVCIPTTTKATTLILLTRWPTSQMILSSGALNTWWRATEKSTTVNPQASTQVATSLGHSVHNFCSKLRSQQISR